MTLADVIWEQKYEKGEEKRGNDRKRSKKCGNGKLKAKKVL
jgi:hypothetical protein